MKDSLSPGVDDFSDPLGLLRADHEQILNHCESLQALLPQIAERGVDDEARRTISRVVGYFTGNAVHHHQDKDQKLFPLLNRQSLKLADIIHRLKREHAELAALWEELLKDLKTPATLTEIEDFPARVEKFCSGYREYIAYERRELLNMAQHILSQQQLEELGDAMARRRGVRR